MGKCFVCGTQENITRCSKCDETWYCPTHYHSHLFSGDCSRFKVEENIESGRYLVATRDIKKGEIILTENAAIHGPMYTKCKLSCLNCLQSQNLFACRNCGWPVCSIECENGKNHKFECSVFSSSEFRPNISFSEETFHLYPCITPLRVLLLRRSNPDAWRVIDTFMDHDEDRESKDNQAWKLHELLVRNFVQKCLQLKFSDNDIRRAIGIIRTNSVKLEHREGLGEGVAVYPTYSYANHSCLCNTFTRKHSDKLDLVAQVDIKAGDQIWTRYTTPQIGSYQRIMDIQKTWHFVCLCARCKDPTELGSMMSAVKCDFCKDKGDEGFLLPKLPTVIGSPWSCSNCKKTVGVIKIQTKIKQALDEIAKYRDNDNDALLSVVTNLEKQLHHNHYLILGVKEIIIQRLMKSIAKAKKNSKTESLLQEYHLRSEMFAHFASVLQVVDSDGTGWLSRLEKIKDEEEKFHLSLRNHDAR